MEQTAAPSEDSKDSWVTHLLPPSSDLLSLIYPYAHS